MAVKFRCRRQVESEGDVAMGLQEAGGHLLGNGLLDRPADDRRFVLTQRDDQDLPRLEDRPHAHRDRLQGHVFLAEEVAGRVLSRDRVERDHSRAAVAGASRLVEADVPRAADSQNLQVDAAGLFDGVLVGFAIGIDVAQGNRPVGNVDVFRREY